ncbi:hypothetical protein [Pararhodobacter sp.]|uniref:hypothetical protein n=1 Tax=Pararhodobacter sp. TaxID=2127056 RepID=UPI002AFED106|nr:hypothetical protein [Pararhodobacter sp.]
MRISAVAGALTLLGLAACSAGPESYATMTTGVGFGDYQRYLQEREASRSASGAPYSVPPEVRSATALVPPTTMPPAPSTLAAVPVRYAAAPVAPPVTAPLAAPMATAAPQSPIAMHPLAAPQQQPPAQAAVQHPAQTAPRPVATASTGTMRTVQADAAFGTTPSFDAGPSLRPQISDEQDFQAVSARESIESDRDRIASQRAQYQVIEVTSVPGHSVSGGPNIVAYALGTNHAPGTEVYRRINPLRWSRWENACLQYRNQDAAQEAFLENGGPERDSGHLDPDGDGYACWWDPTPLRQAMASR